MNGRTATKRMKAREILVCTYKIFIYIYRYEIYKKGQELRWLDRSKLT